ncbi:unnamed protein product [Zymoseptoria tritici ST99CH_1A5]|uniref:F-box domain-containing protein n=1 Tax=Zymoseptoria tritici ST99CH_1A5 TaxID=1276529 RepID=A0A1Y6LGV4_ZYMTR|nr:unnamed protein product [Zymoseptoria tritici ST99CH_1A5]
MTDLLSLPVELVCRVAEFMPPSSHLDFACTCSHLKASLRDILRRHRRAHHQARVSSDVLPSSVPELLRAVIADPIVAWHVREVEWWTSRAKWEDWRPLKLVREGEGDRERYHDVEPLEWNFRQGEVELLLSVAEPHVRNYHMGSGMRESTRDGITEGDHGFMKLLILLLCPRLDSVNSLLDVESTIGHAQNIIPQLQSVMLYAPEPSNSSYYRLEELDGYYPTEGKSGLRQISTTIEDIIFDTGDRDIWIQTNGVQGVSRASVIESLAPQFVIPCFPRPMEVLVIAGNFDDLCGEIPPDEMAKWFDEGLAAMISCKNIYEAAEIVEEERLKFEEMYERDFARRLADHVEGEVLLTREV